MVALRRLFEGVVSCLRWFDSAHCWFGCVLFGFAGLVWIVVFA